MVEFDEIIVILVVILMVGALFACAVVFLLQEQKEEKCVEKNQNSDGSFNYNKIIKCCNEEAGYNMIHCLKSYKPGYKEGDE